MNCVILTPTTGNCRIEYAQSLARLIMYFAQVQVFEGEAEQALYPDAVSGSGISENYERMVERHLENTDPRWTHFLSLEDDMGFPPDALHRLARHRLDIVGANYPTNKGPRQKFTAVGMAGRCETRENSTGLEEAKLMPQGVTLIRREVFEAMPRPWFLVGWNQERRQHVHQDYYFSNEARKHGFRIWVDHDLSKDVTHVGPYNYTYRDVPEEAENGDITRSL